MVALDKNFLSDVDRDSLDREIADTREQVTHLRGTLRRDLLPVHAAKIGLQLDAAVRHLGRLVQLRGDA